MILLGCLLAFSIAVAPRVVLILAWIFSDRWPIVWGTDFIMPLLGIVFLPFTTVMYMLAWQPAIGGGGNIEGWDWMWILLGLLLDLMKWSQILQNRREAQRQVEKYYPSGAPRYGGGGTTDAAVSSGQAWPSTSTTAGTETPPASQPEAPSGADDVGKPPPST